MMERVVLALTNRCNLRCRHCYVEGGEALPVELTLAELADVVTQVAGLAARRLILSGGEPLLVPERLEWTLARAKAAGLRTTVTTNATTLTEERARWLKALGLDTLQVSLDADRPAEHELIRNAGTHARAVAGLQAAVAAGLSCTVMMVAFRHNWPRVGPLAQAAAAWGARLLAVDRFVPVGRGRTSTHLDLDRQDLEGLHRELTAANQQASIPVVTNDPIWNAVRLAEAAPSDFGWARSAAIGCSAGTGSCVIGADGEVFPCTFLPLPLGNTRTHSLRGILAGSPLVTALKDRDRLEGRCGRCRLRLICGGCRAEALVRPGGSLLAEDPLCPVAVSPGQAG